jgi:hypothetical protein
VEIGYRREKGLTAERLERSTEEYGRILGERFNEEMMIRNIGYEDANLVRFSK